jgi:hypothetical protein
MPKWADAERIKAIYAEADNVRQETGCEVHVDHIVPINGVFVCGFHCENNLAILPAIENSMKSNVTWPDMPDYDLLSRAEFCELKRACESASDQCADSAWMHDHGNYMAWRQERNSLEDVLRQYCAVLDSWRSRTQKSFQALARGWDQARMRRIPPTVPKAKPHRLSAALAWKIPPLGDPS